MTKEHLYKLTTTWTGNTGDGTSNYRSYERSITISTANKVDILATSDTAFNSDKTKHNPEELLLASISSCHLLWYLHLCSETGVTVVNYSDEAIGKMKEIAGGGGHFTEVILHPDVIVSDDSMIEKAKDLHHQANKLCYIANSCNFPILHKPSIRSTGSKANIAKDFF
jgi:organic hydroperoxide reductase OsmC/OhrA